MPDFVLEIGFEEMPARFLAGMEEEAVHKFRNLLLESQVVDETFSSLQAKATPRRLAVLAKDLPETRILQEKTILGPSVKASFDAEGRPTKAASGFAASQATKVEELLHVNTEKGMYVAVRKQEGGGPVLAVLPELCVRLVESFTFPKKMRWGRETFAFGRPIRRLLALYGSEAVSFSIAGVSSGRFLYGHRVMGPGPWEVPTASDYPAILENNGRVILDAAKRKEMITAQCRKLAASAGADPVINERLLKEVAGLAEYPHVIMGSFDRKFLAIPKEVLLESMENHQKSFGVEGDSGNLRPLFLTTAGFVPTGKSGTGQTEDKDELVRLGWEKVLRARLEDAAFFWQSDLKRGLDAMLPKLENVIFLQPLGTMAAKSGRISELAAYMTEPTHLAKFISKYPLMESMDIPDSENMHRAGELAKADLVSDMVGEFPELQGIMGGIYAAKQGEPEEVSQAIAEQYLPAGPDTPLPSSLAGAILSIADKIDTLLGLFGLEMIPTGVADPYALRRQALGIVRILLQYGQDFHFPELPELIDVTMELYGDKKWKLPPKQIKTMLLEFFGGRLRAFFTSEGIDGKVVEAILAAGFDDIPAARRRLAALDEFWQGANFREAALTFKRADNIIRKNAAEEKGALNGVFQANLLSEPAEKALAEALDKMGPLFDDFWANGKYADILSLLESLGPKVGDFFDNVMVMAEDPELRKNRLNMLKFLTDRLSRVADFQALQI